MKKAMDAFGSPLTNCASPGELSWEDSHRETLHTHHPETSCSDPWSSSRLSTILSARSYPIPPNLSERYTPVCESPALYGGLISPPTSHKSIENTNNSYNPSPKGGLVPAKRYGPGAGAANNGSTGKYKRLYSRSYISDCESDNDVLERRRKQIRTAQRAYRARQTDKLLDAEKRVQELEIKIQNMVYAVTSLHDNLIRSETLSHDSYAMTQLHNTMQMCLQSIKTSDVADDKERISLHQSDQALAGNSIDLLSSPRQLLPSRASQDASVPVSVFIEQLHVTCIYQGYLSLSDSSIMIDHLQARFRLLLEIMDRDRLATFFEAALHARLSRRKLEGWDDVPFFSLGGAGTHNARPKTIYTCQYHQPCSIVSDPLSHFSSDVKKELDGDWLDMQELEQFLHQKAVHLIACPTRPNLNLSEKTISVAYLIKRLLRKAVCLGRSPGFRRLDVENALVFNDISMDPS